jgi:hypothetical protein
MSYEKAIEALAYIEGLRVPRYNLFNSEYKTAPDSAFDVLKTKVNEEMNSARLQVQADKRLLSYSLNQAIGHKVNNFIDAAKALTYELDVQSRAMDPLVRDLLPVRALWILFCDEAQQLRGLVQNALDELKSPKKKKAEKGSPLRTLGLVAIAGYIGYKLVVPEK